MWKRNKLAALLLALAMLASLAGCGKGGAPQEGDGSSVVIEEGSGDAQQLPVHTEGDPSIPDVTIGDPLEAPPAEDLPSDPVESPEAEPPAVSPEPSGTDAGFYKPLTDLDDVPEFSGEPYVAINSNIPKIGPSDLTTDAFERYADLDELGRCGTAFVNVCQELMPTKERGDISSVKPSGWHNAYYDFIDGGYVYNRCHIVGFQLAGENANEKNLITGTRFLNIEGMLPFENMIADYVKETGNHVLYRVTPVFRGDELVCRGVHMEGFSVEDGGAGVSFNVYAYNAEPGVAIDYATGFTSEGGNVDPETAHRTPSAPQGTQYVLNTRTMKFHRLGCASVESMSAGNREDVTALRDDLVVKGYEPCGICNP